MTKKPKDEKGVIVGSDKNQEWILPWWYYHYSQHNNLPITFMDFGMSKKAIAWCKKRGTVQRVTFPEDKWGKKIPTTSSLKKWTKWRTDIQENRKAWFKKPFACLQSPYHKTIWMDLDCKVLAPIEPIFPFVDNPLEVSVSQNIRHYLVKKKVFYGSGVIAFSSTSPVIKDWVETTLSEFHLHYSDDVILNRLIRKKKKSFHELPFFYNWTLLPSDLSSHENFPIKIIHLDGDKGKDIIETEIALYQMQNIHLTL